MKPIHHEVNVPFDREKPSSEQDGIVLITFLCVSDTNTLIIHFSELGIGLVGVLEEEFEFIEVQRIRRNSLNVVKVVT